MEMSIRSLGHVKFSISSRETKELKTIQIVIQREMQECFDNIIDLFRQSDYGEFKKAAEFEIQKLSVKCSDYDNLKVSYDDLLRDFKKSED